MSRYFAAIPVPPDVCNRLSLLRGNLPNARWVAPEDYHLTLRFIGECDGPTLMHFLEELYQIAATPFQIQLGGLNSFGHAKPRAIWIGTETNPALANLKKHVDHAAKLADLEPDGRKFTPHITLARLSNTRQSAVAMALEGMETPAIAPFIVDRFGVYSSGRSRGGGPYVLEESFSLDPSISTPDFEEHYQ